MRAALGPAGSTIIKKATRFVVLTPLFFLPQGKKSAIERWLRGREQYRKLRRADCVIVSFGKSERTWLPVMMSRFFQWFCWFACRPFLARLSRQMLSGFSC